MSYRLISVSIPVTVTEPVTLVEAKAYMRIDADYTQDDVLIQMMITSSREALEKFTGISFVEKLFEIELTADYDSYWLSDEIPFGPVQSITIVKDKNGVVQTNEIEGYAFPSIYLNDRQVVFVNYVAGYATGLLPKALKLAILKQVATDYENRENYVIGESVNELSNAAENLAFKYSRNLFL